MVINFGDANALFIVDGGMVRLETTIGAIDNLCGNEQKPEVKKRLNREY